MDGNGTSESASAEPRTFEQLLLAGFGWLSLTAEAADDVADDLARRVGIERDAMRNAVRDAVASWRAEAERLGVDTVRRFRQGDAAARGRPARGGRRSRSAGSAARASRPAARDAHGVAGPRRPVEMETAKPQRRIGRLSEIGRVATRHGFGYMIDRRRSNDNTQLADRGRRLREMLDELGPTFVKFGQLLSTRPDVMPPDIIVELRSLQDDVSPIPFADIRRVIEEEMGLRSSRPSSPSTRCRSQRRRSGRCTARRCRRAIRSSSRCSARRLPARSSRTCS